MRYRDPVCGMEIRWEEAVDYEVLGPAVVYFCCAGCAARFREDPARHVDVGAWLNGEAGQGGADCGGEPLELGASEAARKNRSRVGGPRIGDLTLDELEAVVTRRWRRLIGDERGLLRTRTLARGLLTHALADEPARCRDIDRLLAAEVARLRSRDMDRARIAEELAVLPRAFAGVLLDASTGPTEMANLYQAVEDKLKEIRPWVFAPQDASSWSSGPNARAS